MKLEILLKQSYVFDSDVPYPFAFISPVLGHGDFKSVYYCYTIDCISHKWTGMILEGSNFLHFWN